MTHYHTFLISNMTSEFGFGYVDFSFLEKESRYGFYFLFCFHS